MVRQLLKEAVLSLAKRESLSAKKFAIPESKAKKIGVSGEIQGEAKGKYPIDSARRAKNALARVSQFGTPAERQVVRSKVYSKYPGLREGFIERHGESPIAKSNIKKVEQGNIGKTASAIQFSSFVDELVKIALAPMNPLKALKGTFSTNIGNRSSIKLTMPRMNTTTPPIGKVTQIGGSVAPNISGANIRTPTTHSPKMPLQQVTPPASPGHVAPQTTPAASPTAQGAPQKVQTSAPVIGGGSSSSGRSQGNQG